MAAKTAVLAFNGRADRIDSRPGPDGPELVIVDYKTGRSGLDADDARGSQALALYAYAAERVFRRPCRRVELHHLPTGTVAAHEHTEESLARQVRRAEETARDIVAAEKAVAGGADPDEAFPTSAGRAVRAGATSGGSCPAGAEAPAQGAVGGRRARDWRTADAGRVSDRPSLVGERAGPSHGGAVDRALVEPAGQARRAPARSAAYRQRRRRGRWRRSPSSAVHPAGPGRQQREGGGRRRRRSASRSRGEARAPRASAARRGRASVSAASRVIASSGRIAA